MGIAEAATKTPSQVALNWLLQQHNRIFPLVGARKNSQLQDNLEAVNFQLSDEHLKALNRVSKPDFVFPYSMWKNKEETTNFLSRGAGNIINWKMPFNV